MESSSDFRKGMDYSGNLTPSSPAAKFMEQNGAGKVSFSDEINSFQYTNMKPDSFTVDMERFTHLNSKDATLNSRINLQRSLSRKGLEKKMNVQSADNERDNGLVIASSSPRAALVEAATPEKSMVLTVGTPDHNASPQVHHQITIVTGHVPTATTATTTAVTTERRLSGKRFSFRRTSSYTSWTIDPRRILFLFATLFVGDVLSLEAYGRGSEKRHFRCPFYPFSVCSIHSHSLCSFPFCYICLFVRAESLRHHLQGIK